MTVQDQAKKVGRNLLRRKALTASELAERCGQPHGRSLNRCISYMKRQGAIQVVPGRPNKYLLPAV